MSKFNKVKLAVASVAGVAVLGAGGIASASALNHGRSNDTRSSMGSSSLHLASGTALQGSNQSVQGSNWNGNRSANSSQGSVATGVNGGLMTSGSSTNSDSNRGRSDSSSSNGSANANVGVGVAAQGQSQSSDNGYRNNGYDDSNSSSGSLNTGLDLGLGLQGSSTNSNNDRGDRGLLNL